MNKKKKENNEDKKKVDFDNDEISSDEEEKMLNEINKEIPLETFKKKKFYTKWDV